VNRHHQVDAGILFLNLAGTGAGQEQAGLVDGILGDALARQGEERAAPPENGKDDWLLRIILQVALTPQEHPDEDFLRTIGPGQAHRREADFQVRLVDGNQAVDDIARIDLGQLQVGLEMPEAPLQQPRRRGVLLLVAALDQRPHGGLALQQAAGDLAARRRIDEALHVAAVERSRPDQPLNPAGPRVIQDHPGQRLGRLLLPQVHRFRLRADLEVHPLDHQVDKLVGRHLVRIHLFKPLVLFRRERAFVKKDHAVGIGIPALQGIPEDRHGTGRGRQRVEQHTGNQQPRGQARRGAARSVE